MAATTLLACALAPRDGRADPGVWVVDDGEKIRRRDTSSPLARGVDNPVWRPGAEVRTFAMQNESIGLQVVVEAGGRGLEAVSVDLDRLVAEEGAVLEAAPLPRDEAGVVVARPIERFVEQFVEVRRASGGRTPGESLGWEPGSGPRPSAWTGETPDALIPVELAPPWAPYPMRIAPRTNGVVWIDINVPPEQPAGAYRGTIRVNDSTTALASIPLRLDVVDVRLPDRPVGAIAYYDPDELAKRVGPAAEEHLWKVLHAHRIAALHDATQAPDVRRQIEALDGSLYTSARGYFGPAPRVGDGVLSLGAFGSLGDPTDGAESKVEAIADAVAAAGLFEHTDVFLYAIDEDCDSPRGAEWRKRLHVSRDPNLRRVRVAWTCSRDPRSQPVDIAIVDATYRPSSARAAEKQGKNVWVYNGSLPHTGTFLLDSDAVSPRVNGWLAAIDDIPQWFYWESTYWYDRHGRVPVDPFAEAESFHNDDGDWADGDGVLLYPGRQRDFFAQHSLGFDGVVPSIRLKNWRRGVEDAGYVRLARARDPERTEVIARALIPAAFDRARRGRHAAWSDRGKPFFDARRALLDIVLSSKGSSTGEPAVGTSHRRLALGAALAVDARYVRAVGYAMLALLPAAAVVAVAIDHRRKRRRPASRLPPAEPRRRCRDPR